MDEHTPVLVVNKHPLRTFIIECLDRGDRTALEMARRHGHDPQAIVAELRAMAEDGLIEVVE